MRYYQEYKMNHSNTFSLSFPEAKTIIVSGDIHGDFNQLVFKLCIQYKLTDTLLIVAGDCGFGFEKKEYYEQMVRRNTKRMNQANNWIVFVRGNHDNPAYSKEQHSVTNVSLLFLIILSFKPVIILSFV